MLNLIPLRGTTKGTDIFEAVNKVVSEYGGFDKCSCITDGARAMSYIWGLVTSHDIRWLSAGNCLQRFFALRKEIPIFLKDEVKPNTTELENQMVDAQFLADLAFLTDLISNLNELNLKL
ncbi:hypothetical protein JTB14_014699 [Gonioctena quinquepunctata]|nr:hypothetical protein JTB14_014699 [Gonioctena quinquepunctata]